MTEEKILPLLNVIIYQANKCIEVQFAKRPSQLDLEAIENLRKRHPRIQPKRLTKACKSQHFSYDGLKDLEQIFRIFTATFSARYSLNFILKEGDRWVEEIRSFEDMALQITGEILPVLLNQIIIGNKSQHDINEERKYISQRAAQYAASSVREIKRQSGLYGEFLTTGKDND